MSSPRKNGKFRIKSTGKRRKVIVPSTVPDTMEEKVKALALALSDPMDLRTDDELSIELDLSKQKIQSLRSSSSFYEPVLEEFRRKLGSSAIEVMKSLLRQVSRGSSSAARLVLQTLGYIESPGNKVNVLNVNQGNNSNIFSQLSDSELESEIKRLQKETKPLDLSYDKEDNDVTDFATILSDENRGGDPQKGEGETRLVTTGEAEETG